jgi:hypothetical protein
MKIFITFASGANVIELFMTVSYKFFNKLERLSQAFRAKSNVRG